MFPRPLLLGAAGELGHAPIFPGNLEKALFDGRVLGGIGGLTGLGGARQIVLNSIQFDSSDERGNLTCEGFC